MPLSFLAPVFLAGLAALAIPVLIHLANRPRRQVVRFPSLMFLEKVEFRASSKKRLRDLLLFALRVLALILLVGAFSRPFLDRPDAPPVAVDGGREIVVLLDRSHSMSVGDRMDRAKEAVGDVAAGLRRGDRATLVVFDHLAAAANRATSEAAVLTAAADTVEPGSGATRLAPPLRLAESILAGSPLPRRELVVISDFQRQAWDAEAAVTLPAGTEVRGVAVGEPAPNLAVSEVAVARERFAGRDRARITGRLVRRSGAAGDVRISLVVDGRVAQRQTVSVPETGGASVTFDPITLPDQPVRAEVRVEPADGDAVAGDNAFHFVLSADRSLRVLVVTAPATPARSRLYLERALEVGPDHDVAAITLPALDAGDLAGVDVVVLNDADFPTGETGRRLREWVEAGGGLVAVVGGQVRGSSWGGVAEGLFPAAIDRTVSRLDEGGTTIARVVYDHPVFRPFRQPGSGELTAARVYRYRAVDPAAGATVLARYDDGGVALVEGRAGQGRVLVMTAALDAQWSDLVLKPSFVPMAHQLVRHASGRQPVPASRTVGDLVDTGTLLAMEPEQDASDENSPVVVSPSGRRTTIRPGETLVRLDEHGVYEVRDPRTPDRPALVAVNMAIAESDLSRVEAETVVAALRPTDDSPVAASFAPEDRERRQSLWWYFLAAAFLLMVTETALSNGLARSRRRAGHMTEE